MCFTRRIPRGRADTVARLHCELLARGGANRDGKEKTHWQKGDGRRLGDLEVDGPELARQLRSSTGVLLHLVLGEHHGGTRHWRTCFAQSASSSSSAQNWWQHEHEHQDTQWHGLVRRLSP